MKSILKYTFSLILTLGVLAVHAQQSVRMDNQNPETSGLRIGIDLAEYVTRIVIPEIRGFELLAQYEVAPNLLIAGEGGYQRAQPDFKDYTYSIQGTYGRLGVDLNVLNNPNDHDILFLGLRYGFSFYNHQATDVPIRSYWGNKIVDMDKEELQAHWVELVFGMNAELFFAKNFYIGWIGRGKFLVSGNNYEILSPFLIPGFSYQDTKVAVGITWSLMYRIPLK